MAPQTPFRAAVASGICALAVTGCGGGGDEFPAGRWSASAPSVGRVVAEYRQDGTWTLFYGLKLGRLNQGTSGLYSTTDDTITFEADSYCKANRPHVEQGTYAWALDQGRLILTARYDPCPDRMTLMDGVAYRRMMDVSLEPDQES